MGSLRAQELQAGSIDTDHDGLSDALEQELLAQFAPTFLVADHDCSALPAQFIARDATPKVAAEDGTIYGQVSPVHGAQGGHPQVEVHFFHLWRLDCGAHPHPLDTEHVAVLLQGSRADVNAAKWKALYWYAGAHESTVCDVSQIARASTLHAEDHGATVWISEGKHASYLNETLCRRGCGADSCERMKQLPQRAIINLGEPGAPMNDVAFVSSNRWPLAAKMTATNFPTEPVARLEQLPTSEIAWFNPGRHPAQGVIAISGTTANALSNSGANTAAAIDVGQDATGNALATSYRKTKHALGKSLHATGKALGLSDEKQPLDGEKKP